MKRVTRTIVAVALCALATGCLYDPADVCGQHQELDEATGGCRCSAGAIQAAGECSLCPDGEVVFENACVCPEGEVRGEGGVCVLKPDTLGQPCDGEDLTCDDETYPRCEIDDEEAGTGYCTSEGCVEQSECEGGYTCATWASPAYCERPPTGMGEACSEQSDCESFEADLCFPFTGECINQACDLELGDCSAGYHCCDASAFDPSLTTVCVPESFTCP